MTEGGDNNDFYVRYYVGHKGIHYYRPFLFSCIDYYFFHIFNAFSGKFGHEFLEFEFRPNGQLRYANNSNYKNDTLIRKEVSSMRMTWPVSLTRENRQTMELLCPCTAVFTILCCPSSNWIIVIVTSCFQRCDLWNWFIPTCGLIWGWIGLLQLSLIQFSLWKLSVLRLVLLCRPWTFLFLLVISCLFDAPRKSKSAIYPKKWEETIRGILRSFFSDMCFG